MSKSSVWRAPDNQPLGTIAVIQGTRTNTVRNDAWAFLVFDQMPINLAMANRPASLQSTYKVFSPRTFTDTSHARHLYGAPHHWVDHQVSLMSWWDDHLGP